MTPPARRTADDATDQRHVDHLFADSQDAVDDFIFDDDVADVFDDMLHRSIPCYEETQRQVAELAAHFLSGGGTIYDIGCSTGTTLTAISDLIHTAATSIRCVGLEPSPGMRARASAKFSANAHADRFALLGDTVEQRTSLPDARVVTMLYTLQFVRPLCRQRAISMIFDSLPPGGALIMTEKILCEDHTLRRLYIDLYHDLKRRQGYTSTEISRKREALENVLIPFTEAENKSLLVHAGFEEVETFFRWYNFAGFIGVKT